MTNSLVISSNFEEYKQAFLEENSKHNLISKNDEKVAKKLKFVLQFSYIYDKIYVIRICQDAF